MAKPMWFLLTRTGRSSWLAADLSVDWPTDQAFGKMRHSDNTGEVAERLLKNVGRSAGWDPQFSMANTVA
jgi:hypothetical protein